MPLMCYSIAHSIKPPKASGANTLGTSYAMSLVMAIMCDFEVETTVVVVYT